MFVDYYAVLNLHPSCSARDVRDAFKRFALLYHPDRASDADVGNFRAIKDAYDVLSDPARRYLYDLGYAEILQIRQRQEEDNLARISAARLHRQHQYQQSQLQQQLQQQLRQQQQQQQQAQSQRPHPREDGTTLTDATQCVPTLTSCTRSLHPTRSSSQQVLPPVDPHGRVAAAAAADDTEDVESHSGVDVGDSPIPLGTSSKSTAPPTPIKTATSTTTPILPPLRCQQQQQEERWHGQSRRRQSKNGRGCGNTSILVPKTTTLQWGAEVPRARRLLGWPTEESVSACVTKTWEVFFHLHETEMEGKTFASR